MFRNKRQEVKIICSAQCPEGKEPFLIPLVISNGSLFVPVTTHIRQRFAEL